MNIMNTELAPPTRDYELVRVSHMYQDETYSTCLRAASNSSDETTHDSIPSRLRSESDIISNFVVDFPSFLFFSSIIIERSRIPSYPRISGDDLLR